MAFHRALGWHEIHQQGVREGGGGCEAGHRSRPRHHGSPVARRGSPAGRASPALRTARLSRRDQRGGGDRAGMPVAAAGCSPPWRTLRARTPPPCSRSVLIRQPGYSTRSDPSRGSRAPTLAAMEGRELALASATVDLHASVLMSPLQWKMTGSNKGREGEVTRTIVKHRREPARARLSGNEVQFRFLRA